MTTNFGLSKHQVSPRVRKASLTSVVNAVLAVARVAISALYVSLLIGYLGRDDYGLAISVTSVAAWLSISQLGIGQSLKNSLLRLNAGIRGVVDSQVLLSSAFVTMLGCSVVVSIVGAFIAYSVPWNTLIKYQGGRSALELKELAAASFCVVILTVPFTVIKAAYGGYQVEYKLGPYLLAGMVVSILGLLLAINLRANIAVVGVMPLMGNLLGLCFSLHGLKYFAPLRFRKDTIRPRLIKPLLRPGIGFLGIELSGIMLYQTQPLIISLFLGSAAAAVYSLHNQLILYGQAAIGLVTTPYWQAFGDAWHSGETEWLRRSVHRLAAFAAIGSIAMFSFMLLVGSGLVARWSHNQVAWNVSLGIVLCVTGVLQNTIAPYSIALNAMGVIRQSFVAAASQAILTIVLTITLMRATGIVGVGLAVLIGFASTVGWYLPSKFRATVANQSALASRL